MASTTDTPQETLFAWRVATFEELGFGTEQAAVLADAKSYTDVKTKTGTALCGTPLHYSAVRKMQENGWTNDQILQVFS